jgi:hypothetical protein
MIHLQAGVALIMVAQHQVLPIDPGRAARTGLSEASSDYTISFSHPRPKMAGEQQESPREGVPGETSPAWPASRSPRGVSSRWGRHQRPSRLRNGPVGLGLDGLPGIT